MKLGKPEPVGVLDNQRIAIRNIDARLNNGGANEYVYVALKQVTPDFRQLLLAHSAVRHGYTSRRHHFLYLSRRVFRLIRHGCGDNIPDRLCEVPSPWPRREFPYHAL